MPLQIASRLRPPAPVRSRPGDHHIGGFHHRQHLVAELEGEILGGIDEDGGDGLAATADIDRDLAITAPRLIATILPSRVLRALIFIPDLPRFPNDVPSSNSPAAPSVSPRLRPLPHLVEGGRDPAAACRLMRRLAPSGASARSKRQRASMTSFIHGAPAMPCDDISE
jgi:hypothetical protein